MVILACDLATKTGWCLLKNGTIHSSGVLDLSKKRNETNGLMFLRFRKWIIQMHDDFDPDIYAYERAHHRGGAATDIGLNLQGRIDETAAQYRKQVAPTHSTTLKKWATGNGRASKDEMMEIAKQYLGRKPKDDNEADAVLIAMWTDDIYGEDPF